jgi:hypothetical protein
MENSRIIQILELLRHSIETIIPIRASGICAELDWLACTDMITEDEYEFMEEFIENSKPDSNQFTKFTKLDCWTNTMHWWIPIFKDESTIQVRVDYLNELITTIKERN